MKKKIKINKTAVLNVRLTPAKMEQVIDKANLLEITPSALVRDWIEEKLEKKNKQ